MKSLKIFLIGLVIIIFIGIIAYRLVLNRENLAPFTEKSFSGFIRTIKGNVVAIDEAEFLSGAEARRLGALDTGCPEVKIENCIPSLNNDFYIRNLSPEVKSYTLTDDVVINYLSNPGSPVLASTTAPEFIIFYPIQTTTLGFSQLFHFNARGNRIVWMEEQYTP